MADIVVVCFCPKFLHEIPFRGLFEEELGHDVSYWTSLAGVALDNVERLFLLICKQHL
jgi:hypothetical protein